MIERALGAGIEPFAVLVERCWLTQTEPLIERLIEADATLPVFVATREQMRALTGFERTRGALAAFRRPALPPPGSLLEIATRVAVLENVTNHTNIGAIFRSAAALGIDAVLVTPSCHDPFSTAARRACRWARCSKFRGRASAAALTGLATACRFCTSTASPPAPWPFPTTPSACRTSA